MSYFIKKLFAGTNSSGTGSGLVSSTASPALVSPTEPQTTSQTAFYSSLPQQTIETTETPIGM